jgi:hypothetical protein
MRAGDCDAGTQISLRGQPGFEQHRVRGQLMLLHLAGASDPIGQGDVGRPAETLVRVLARLDDYILFAREGFRR